MSSNGIHQKALDELFPAPALPPSLLAPQRLPGTDPESLAALQEVLKDNHQRHHIFFNDLHFHNHVTHRALAVYALGASGTIIRDYYKRDSLIQRLAIKSPEPITEENFVDHLVDENYYQAYVNFFTKQLAEKSAEGVLEEFIFSDKYNSQKGNAQPNMFARFFSGLFHPMIHVGYGVEFGLKGMFVEGLALTAVHSLRGTIPASIFDLVPSDEAECIAERLSALALDAPVASSALIHSKTGGVHAFDLVARILDDVRFKRMTRGDFNDRFVETFKEYSPMVAEYAEKWTIDLNQPGEIERKMEELIWLGALLYGAGGLTVNGFQSDFFLMHVVTSSLFLPSLISYLSTRSKLLLLRGYLHMVLMWWIMRGRPTLKITSFMTTTPVEPRVATIPAPKAPLTTETTVTPNAFLPLLQSALPHPGEHLPKIQRAFAHFSALYGGRPAGYFGGTELKEAELLDGSLFLRAAVLTADYMGWVREGEKAAQWSFEGFFGGSA